MKAIVLSGGGDKVHYQIGALDALMGDQKEKYDILCGVSCGALVAAYFAQYKIGQEDAALICAKRMFNQIVAGSIYKRWFPFGKLHGVLGKPGLLNADPLRKLISRNLDQQRVRESGRKLRIGATSLTTGVYHLFTEQSDPLKGIVYASAAFPGMFQPAEFAGGLWTDGGLRTVTPIQAAIDAGAEEVDIVMCSPQKPQPSFDPKPNAVSVILRSVDIMMEQIIEDDLKVARMYNRLCAAGLAKKKKHIKFRLVRPELPLGDGDPLSFDRADTEPMQHAGFQDAMDIQTLDAVGG